MLSEVLRQGFRLLHRRLHLVFLDLVWKSIWLVLTLAGLFFVAVWFGAQFRSMEWVATGNRAVNGAIAVALLRRFWLAKHAAIFAAVSTVLFLSLVAWFLLEACFRARIMSAGSPPQLSASRSAEEGNPAFDVFLLSHVLKYFFIATAVLALAAICFGRYFSTPLSEWPQLWPDTSGAAISSVVA